jgi:hypothetical protein
MWKEDEHVARCPDCGVELVPLHQLPPSAETLLEREAELHQIPLELQKRSVFDLSRGRGLMVVIAVLGLAGFFQPWFIMEKPETLVLSGFKIARFFAGWLWAGAVGWFILIPLVLSRRTIADLRGVRIICAFFASLTLGEILVLANSSPTSKVRVPVEFGWSYGLFWSALASIFGIIVAMKLGGSLPRRADPEMPESKRGSAKLVRRSRYETLH